MNKKSLEIGIPERHKVRYNEIGIIHVAGSWFHKGQRECSRAGP
jgi:hypothetical protein